MSKSDISETVVFAEASQKFDDLSTQFVRKVYWATGMPSGEEFRDIAKESGGSFELGPERFYDTLRIHYVVEKNLSEILELNRPTIDTNNTKVSGSKVCCVPKGDLIVPDEEDVIIYVSRFLQLERERSKNLFLMDYSGEKPFKPKYQGDHPRFTQEEARGLAILFEKGY